MAREVDLGSIIGPQGETGPTGKSAYQVWLAQPGNAGKTEAQYIASLKGAKGDTGATGPQGQKGDTGAKGETGDKGATGTRGSRWNAGTAITGTSATATVFPGSEITDALVNDMYLNTSTGCTYRCTVSGAASAAKWVYAGSLKGNTGAKGDTGATGATGATGKDGQTPTFKISNGHLIAVYES